jgi:hypothetical protein
MSNLFVFGCSYTQGFNRSKDNKNYQLFKNYRGGDLPKDWSTLLSEKLGFNLNNYGEDASGNNQIFQEICSHCDEFNEGDIVIIGWTFIDRYRWVDYGKNTWKKLGSGKINFDFIGESTHEEIVYNRTHPFYIEEIYNYEKMIDQLSDSKKFKVYYWSAAENNIITNIPTEKLRQIKKYILSDQIHPDNNNLRQIITKMGGLTIKEETDGFINDYHLGESGHKVQSELFYKHIIE